MAPCDACGGCDWLPFGYCNANAPTASTNVHEKIAALMRFIVDLVSFRVCGQSLCDAVFPREEGRPAHNQKKVLKAEKLIEQHGNFRRQQLCEADSGNG
jgi:hypothetical protein